MATMPNSVIGGRALTVDELAALAGTPEFEVEYRRQMATIAERDRATKNADRMPVDWESLGSWE